MYTWASTTNTVHARVCAAHTHTQGAGIVSWAVWLRVWCRPVAIRGTSKLTARNISGHAPKPQFDSTTVRAHVGGVGAENPEPQPWTKTPTQEMLTQNMPPQSAPARPPYAAQAPCRRSGTHTASCGCLQQHPLNILYAPCNVHSSQSSPHSTVCHTHTLSVA